MKIILTTAAALIAVAATLSCTGCGGGDPAMPAVPHHTDAAGKRAWVLIHLDAADDLDLLDAMESYRHAYHAEPHGVMLATDEASASMARAVLVDALGTDRFHVETIR